MITTTNDANTINIIRNYIQGCIFVSPRYVPPRIENAPYPVPYPGIRYCIDRCLIENKDVRHVKIPKQLIWIHIPMHNAYSEFLKHGGGRGFVRARQVYDEFAHWRSDHDDE